MSSSIDAEDSVMGQLQDALSYVQALPIIGPAMGSPIKALVSTGQVIISVAGVVFGSLGYLACWSFDKEWVASCRSMVTDSSSECLKGLSHLVYAIGNAITLGAWGFSVELKGCTKNLSSYFCS